MQLRAFRVAERGKRLSALHEIQLAHPFELPALIDPVLGEQRGPLGSADPIVGGAVGAFDLEDGKPVFRFTKALRERCRLLLVL